MGWLRGRTLGWTVTSEQVFDAFCPDAWFGANAFFQSHMSWFAGLPAHYAGFYRPKSASCVKQEDAFGHFRLRYQTLAPAGFSLQFGWEGFFRAVLVGGAVFPFPSSDANFRDCRAWMQVLIMSEFLLFFSALPRIVVLSRFCCCLDSSGSLRFWMMENCSSITLIERLLLWKIMSAHADRQICCSVEMEDLPGGGQQPD